MDDTRRRQPAPHERSASHRPDPPSTPPRRDGDEDALPDEGDEEPVPDADYEPL